MPSQPHALIQGAQIQETEADEYYQAQRLCRSINTCFRMVGYRAMRERLALMPSVPAAGPNAAK